MGVTLATCVIGNFESSPVQAGGAEAGRCDGAYGECGLPAPGNLPGLKVNPLSLDDGAWLGTPHFTARVTQSLMGSSDRMVVWHPPPSLSSVSACQDQEAEEQDRMGFPLPLWDPHSSPELLASALLLTEKTLDYVTVLPCCRYLK